MSYQQPGEYYKHSGKVPVYSIFYLLFIGIFGSATASLIYGAILSFSNILYLNIAVWMLYMIVLGGIAVLMGKLGKIRNMLILSIYAIIIGLFGAYFSWVFYMVISAIRGVLTFKEGVDFFQEIVQDPRWIYSTIIDYAYNGNISIRGTDLHPFIILAYWVIEALGAIIACLVAVWIIISDQPFDERTLEWANKDYIVEPLLPTGSGADAMKTAAEKGNFAPIHEFKKLPINPPIYWKLKLLYNESQTLFVMALKEVKESVDKDGNKSTAEDYVIKNLIVDKATFADLLSVGKEPPTTGPVEADLNTAPEPASREPGQIAPDETDGEDDPYRTSE